MDDIYGYDFSGYTVDDQDNDPSDPAGHGTHVAGTIGAVGNNSLGVTGVCWNVKIMPAKIMPPYLISEWVAFVSNAVEAIDYAVANGAKIINASWGIDDNYSQSLKDAIQSADNSGVLFVAAAGNYPNTSPADNDIGPQYPSNYDLDNIIAVMATDHDDNMSSFSHYGATSVDLAAPGSGIYSCVPDDSYDTYNGTSMAAPHVAGACALLWSKYPSLSHLQIKDAILDTVDELNSLEGLCVTGGRLNLFRAISETFPLSVDINDGIDPNSCGIDPTDPNNNTITYTLVVTHEGSGPNFPIDPNDPNSPSDPNITGDIENVTLVDYLPSNIDPVNVTVTGPGSYNMFDGTVTWYFGTLSPGDSNSVTVTVTILEGVEPLGEIINVAEVSAGDGSSSATISTPVCCYGGDIIYVDSKANGWNVGLSWQNAYKDLSSALNRASKGCGGEIWVAGGTYHPSNVGNASASFELVDDVEIYGGFSGHETARSQRDFVQYKTYLSGDISATDNDPNSDYVVSAGNGVTDSAILDGFVICRGVKAGIYLYDQAVMDQLADPNAQPPTCDISPGIVNCYVTNNEGDGIHGQLADPSIYGCIIADNGGYGIIDANSLEIDIDRCVIRNNALAGIDAHIADSGNITNCFIYQNAEGILCYGETASGAVEIRNNTIVLHEGPAIVSDPNNAVTVLNSIIWDCNSTSPTIGCELDYCFIDTDTVSGTNYNTDPGFAYTEPNACNFHLAADSDCIDAGKPLVSYPGEVDIDGEVRVYNSRVDVGADEVTSCNDVASTADLSGDGVVNNIEFSLLSAAWMTYDPCSPPDTGDPNFLDDFGTDSYDSRSDYDSDGMVYLTDLDALSADWLWVACWKEAAEGTWFEIASTGSSSLQVPGTTSAAMSMSFSSASMAAGPAPAPSLSPAEQLLQASGTLDFLNKIYKDELKGQINPKTWKEFMNHLEGWVGSLAEDYLKSIE